VSRARVGLLTGPVGIGKTTVAGRVVLLARRHGLACAGLLAPALVDACGHKVGIWGVDLAAGERCLLARTDRDLGGPAAGPYSFDPEALAWAVGVVDRALDGLRPTDVKRQASSSDEPGVPGMPASLLVVDEIGKLELWQGAGLAPVLRRLAAGEAPLSLVIVRDSLLAELQARLGDVEQILFRLDEANRDDLPPLLLEQLVGRLSSLPHGGHAVHSAPP